MAKTSTLRPGGESKSDLNPVLEFTAIVVIIFAAVFLGVLGLLGDQHRDLFAAIAGYVLGKKRSAGSLGPN
jgi:hypothetical protein